MILVVGATGVVGSEVCRQLVKSGRPVRALVRPASDTARVAELRASGIETVVGDVRDRASLDRACRGIDSVVCTISSMPTRYEAGVNDIATVDVAGVRHLIDAAVGAGVRRLVYTSFSGHIDTPFPLRDAKRQVESWLRESPLDWTILRPSYFMEVWLSPAVGFDPVAGRVTIYGAGDAPISWISTTDVAAFAVTALVNPATSRAVLELGGPTPVTPLDVIRIFETTFGRSLDLAVVPIEVLREREAAAIDPMERSFAALMTCYAAGDPIEMGRTAAMLPRPLRTVREYAASLRPAALVG